MSAPSRQELRTSKLVRVSSIDRDEDSSSRYDLHVSFNDYALHQVRRVILKSLTIPNTYYNINRHNNEFVYDLGFGPIGFKVGVGQYTLTELADELVALFASQPVPVVMTYTIDSVKTKLELTFSADIEITNDGTINSVLGLESDVSTMFVAASPQTLPNIFNLSGLRKVFIGSHTLALGTTMTSSDGRNINIFTEAEIDVAYGGIQHRTLSDLHTSDEITHSTPFNISNMDVTLYDQDLNVLDLNGREWSMVLKVFN